jgi:hypothetical protein
MLAAYSSDHHPRRHPWLADTAASQTLVTDLHDILDYKPFIPGDQEYTYATSSGENACAKGRGRYQLHLTADGQINKYIINCIYQPNVPCNTHKGRTWPLLSERY